MSDGLRASFPIKSADSNNDFAFEYSLEIIASSPCSISKESVWFWRIFDFLFGSLIAVTIPSRRRVLYICNNDWNNILKREERASKEVTDNEDILKQRAYNTETKFWICVNRAESYFGLGEFDNYYQAVAAAREIPHEPWMMASFEDQVVRLRSLLETNGHLLNPAWKEVRKMPEAVPANVV